jgi:hypothetical protein
LTPIWARLNQVGNAAGSKAPIGQPLIGQVLTRARRSLLSVATRMAGGIVFYPCFM